MEFVLGGQPLAKGLEVLAVGEHNSPSPRTPVPRDQFKLHELIGDICRDGFLPSPLRECPRPNDDSHAEEEPSKLPSPMRDYPRPDDDSHAEEEPSKLPSPVRDYPQPDDDSHTEVEPSELPSPVRDCPWLDDDSHAEEKPSEQTPVSTDSQNNESCLG